MPRPGCENNDVFRGQRESQWGWREKGGNKGWGKRPEGSKSSNMEGHSGLRKEWDVVSRAAEGPLKSI